MMRVVIWAAIAFLFVASRPAYAIENFVSSLPTGEQVISETHGASQMDADARRVIAIRILEAALLAGVGERMFTPGGRTAEERARAQNFTDARVRIDLRYDGSEAWREAKRIYSGDPAFEAEIMTRYMSPEVVTAYRAQNAQMDAGAARERARNQTVAIGQATQANASARQTSGLMTTLITIAIIGALLYLLARFITGRRKKAAMSTASQQEDGWRTVRSFKIEGAPCNLNVLSGEVVGTDQRSDTHVYGGGSISGVGGNVHGSTSVSSVVVVQRDLWLRDDAGREHEFRFTVDLPLRASHRVHIIQLEGPEVLAHQARSIYLSAYNESVNKEAWLARDNFLRWGAKAEMLRAFWFLIVACGIGLIFVFMSLSERSRNKRAEQAVVRELDLLIADLRRARVAV